MSSNNITSQAGNSQSVDTSSTDSNTQIITDTNLILEPTLLDVRWIRENIDQLRFDYPLAYQRHYDPWNKSKKESYIRGIWNGLSTKDLFIIVDIKSVLENIPNNDRRKSTLRFKNDLKTYLKRKIYYLVVDGQHRIKLFSEYLLEKSYPDSTPFTFINGNFTVATSTNEVSLTKHKFKEINSILQNYYLNQKIMCVIVKKATLNGLKKLFIDSNDGIPVSLKDKRNAGNSNIVEHISNVANHPYIFDYIFKDDPYTGKFENRKRGHELISTILLAFEIDPENPRLNNEKFFDSLFDTDHPLHPRDEFDEPKTYPTSILKRHKSNMETLAIMCKHMNKTFLKQKGRLYNLYMFISLMYCNSHDIKRKNNINSGYKINKPEALVDWFVKSELTREEEDRYVIERYKDGTPKLDKKTGSPIYVMQHSTKKKNFGKLEKIKNTTSYYTASHDARNEESTGIILNKLLQDVSSNIDKWLSLGYIIPVGKVATRVQKDTSLVQNNFTDIYTGKEMSSTEMYDGTLIHHDHTLPKSLGGTGEDNLRPMSAKANIQRSNK